MSIIVFSVCILVVELLILARLGQRQTNLSHLEESILACKSRH